MSECEIYVITDVEHLCRLCLDTKGFLTDIFRVNEEWSLVEQIAFLMDLIVTPEDALGTKICHRCLYKIEQLFQFKQQVLESQRILSESPKADIKTDSAVMAPNQTIFCTPTVVNCEMEENLKSNFQNIVINSIQSKSTLNTGYPTTIEATKNNYCLICLEKFTHKSAVENHVRDHLDGTGLSSYFNVGERNVMCGICNRMFNFRFNYVEHVREHLNIKPFACTHSNCSNSYYTNPALKHHLVQHSERTFFCDKCKIGFKRKSDLRSHQIIHEDEGLKFSCKKCGILCKNRNSLMSHWKKHTVTPKYTCEACQKRFYSQSELSRHSFSHSAQKQFRCDTCDRAYYSRSTLLRHKKQKCAALTE